MRFDFVSPPPTRVGALATALNLELGELLAGGESSMGTLYAPPAAAPATHPRALPDDVATFAARYVWDIHHERPVTSASALESRRLASYAVRFNRGRSRCEAALRACHGDPRPAHKPGSESGSYRRYGPFFVDAGIRDDFLLEWYEREPDWAKPAVDAAARRHALSELATRIRLAEVEDELDAAIASLRPGAAIRATPRSRGDAGRRLEIDPPMSAIDVAAALGHLPPVAQSVGVHMSLWRIMTRRGQRTAVPCLGAWEVDAALDGACGDVFPEIHVPAAVVRALGARDVVRSLRITPRPRGE